MVLKPVPKNVVVRLNKVLSKGRARGRRKVTAANLGLPASEAEALALKYAEGWLIKLFSKLKTADHRDSYSPGGLLKVIAKGEDPHNALFYPGDRVRTFDVSRNFPEIGEVIIKKVDADDTSRDVLINITDRVNRHNSRHIVEDLPYILRPPFGAVLGRKFILMSRTNFPSVYETIPRLLNPQGGFSTLRGRTMLKQLRKAGINEMQLADSYAVLERLYGRPIAPRNILVVGNLEHQVIFVPLLDID